jgi:hypothetical protein
VIISFNEAAAQRNAARAKAAVGFPAKVATFLQRYSPLAESSAMPLEASLIEAVQCLLTNSITGSGAAPPLGPVSPESLGLTAECACIIAKELALQAGVADWQTIAKPAMLNILEIHMKSCARYLARDVVLWDLAEKRWRVSYAKTQDIRRLASEAINHDSATARAMLASVVASCLRAAA